MKQIAKWAVLGIAAVVASATPGGAQFIAPACVVSVAASCDPPVEGATSDFRKCADYTIIPAITT